MTADEERELAAVRAERDAMAGLVRSAVGFVSSPGLFRVLAWRRRAMEALTRMRDREVGPPERRET